MIRKFGLLAIASFLGISIQAATWEDVAARFGCTNKVHASEQAGGSQYIMEFVPQGQKLNTQERMFTVTLVRTSAAEAFNCDLIASSLSPNTMPSPKPKSSVRTANNNPGSAGRR